MNIVPITYLARKAFKKQRSAAEAADKVVEVWPAEVARRPKAYFDPAQLDRIRAFQSMGGREAQMARITEGSVTHAATRALHFRNARLLGGSFYSRGSRSQLLMQRPPRGPRFVEEKIESAALVGTPIGSIFFGHYLTDDSATTLLAQEFGPVYRARNKLMESWTHANSYRRLMDLEVPELPDTYLSEAWLFEDLGMNAHRRQRMKQVRARLAGLPADQSGHRVFIIRGSFGQNLRILENEAALAEALSQRGFTIVNPMQESTAEIIRKIAGASLVVSVEGSALTHAYLTMQEGGAMITIQPPYRFDNVWKDFTDLLGMRYGFVVGEGDQERFRVSVDDVMRAVDLISA